MTIETKRIKVKIINIVILAKQEKEMITDLMTPEKVKKLIVRFILQDLMIQIVTLHRLQAANIQVKML